MIQNFLLPRAAFAAVASAFVLTASGCGDSGSADTDELQVLAGFYPFAFVAERVAGDNASVTNLTNPGLEPHDLELTLRQVTELSEADLVIYLAGFQPTVDSAIEQNPPARVLEVSEVVSSRPATSSPDGGEANSSPHGGEANSSPDGGEANSSPDGEHSDGATEEMSDDHVSLEADPHLWQDPTLLIAIAGHLATDLGEADAEHAEDYTANAAALATDLQELDQEFEAGLADCERRDIVTSHAAFGYLAQRYDLTMIPIAGLSPDAEPSLEHLTEIQDLVESRGITTVFSETLGSKQYAETLAEDLGVTAAVLDPVEGLTEATSQEDYLSLMRSNLEVLRRANNCS